MDKPMIFEYSEKSVNYTIFDVKWIPCSAKFCVIGSKPMGTGVIEIYELKGPSLEFVKSIEKKTSFKCGSFGASSLRKRHLAVGDFNGRLLILDLERPDIPVFNTQAHTAIINSIDAIGGTQINCGAPEIVTGSRDGVVKVWDPRQNNAPVIEISSEKIKNVGNGEGLRDCWAVTFGDSYDNDNRLVAAGFDNGDIKLFDLRNLSIQWETTLQNGICCIEFDRIDIPKNKMVVTTLEGGLHVYDMRTQHPEKGFSAVTERNAGRSVGSNGVITGPKATLWSVRHLPQNRDIFITSGGTGSLRLWNYEYPEKRTKEASDGILMGVTGKIKLLNAVTMSTQPINCFDWHPEKRGLGLCGSFDQTVRVLITTNLNLYN